MRGLARLVVLDDPAGAEGVEIDPVDLSRERERAEIETALELLGRALRAERNLEPPRHQLQLRGGLVAEESLEVAEQPLLKLSPLQVGQLHPDARHRLGEALAHELERVVELFGPELFDAEPLRDTGEELVQGTMSDLAAEARVDDLVDRARPDQPVDEPDRRAVGEGLQLGDAEARLRPELLEDERVSQAGRSLEGPQRTVEPPLPAVRLRQRAARALVESRQRSDCAQSFALGRRLLDRPGERGERPPCRRAAHLVFPEEVANLVPERACLARPALVVCRLAHEVQPPRRARAGRVEEVAVARHGVRLREPRAAQTRVELASGLLVEERRRLAAPRQRSLLEAKHEDDLVTARARAQEIDDVDPPGFSRAGRAHGNAFNGCDDLVGSQRAAESEPALELVDEPGQGLEGAQILAGFLADRRGLEPVGGAEHEAGEVAQRRERRLRLAEELERGERVSVAEPHCLLFRPLAGLDGAAPEPTFDPIDARAGETRVGGAQEPVQHSATAALPGESKQREQGAPV